MRQVIGVVLVLAGILGGIGVSLSVQHRPGGDSSEKAGELVGGLICGSMLVMLGTWLAVWSGKKGPPANE